MLGRVHDDSPSRHSPSCSRGPGSEGDKIPPKDGSVPDRSGKVISCPSGEEPAGADELPAGSRRPLQRGHSSEARAPRQRFGPREDSNVSERLPTRTPEAAARRQVSWLRARRTALRGEGSPRPPCPRA